MKIKKLSGSCNWGDEIECSAHAPIFVASLLWLMLSAGYCTWYATYLAKAYRQLKGRLYQRFRISNVLLQLQVCSTMFAQRFLPTQPLLCQLPVLASGPPGHEVLVQVSMQQEAPSNPLKPRHEGEKLPPANAPSLSGYQNH